jgi:hypothetical protein
MAEISGGLYLQLVHSFCGPASHGESKEEQLGYDEHRLLPIYIRKLRNDE